MSERTSPGAGGGPSAVQARGSPAAGEPVRAPHAGPARGQRRPADRWKAAFVILALAAIVAGVAWALLGSRFFIVRSITVTGEHRVTRAQVVAAAGIQPGTPLIRVDTTAAGRRVEAIAQVRVAQVSRSWPDGIVIHITERTPALAIHDGGRYDLIDGSGVVIASVARRPPPIPEFIPSGAVRGNPAVAAAASVVHELPSWLARRLISVAAPKPGEVTLRLTRGVSVIWGDPHRAAEKTRVLAALLRTHAHVYDVSSPAVAVTR